MMSARRGGNRIGYVRVSSLDQNEQRQLEGMDIDKKFTDKASGKDMNRPQLKAALDYLRDGGCPRRSLDGSIGEEPG